MLKNNHITFFDFLILIEHFILEEVEIKSLLVFIFLSFNESFAVINPLSFFDSFILYMCSLTSFLLSLNLVRSWLWAFYII